MVNPKELKKLADICRKAGIKHFKSVDFEFTLTEESISRNTVKQGNLPSNELLKTEDLSDEEKMFWSVGNPIT